MLMNNTLQSIKQDKRLTLTLYLTVIGSVFIVVFGFISWSNDIKLTSIMLFSAFFLGLFNLYLMTTKYRDITRYNLAFIVGIIGLFLMAFGGQDATGHLWTYPIMTLAIAVLSLREGILFTSVYLSFTCAVLFMPFTFIIQYEFLTATRYFISALALCSITLVLVSIQENTSRQLKLKTVTDDLTGLFNRAVLNDATFQQLSESKSSHENYLLLIDIDHFKKINDNFGHSIGDEVLKILGNIMHSNLRENDLAIRWGGEEFLVILRNCPPLKAKKIAHKLRMLFEQDARILRLLQRPATMSIGLAATGSSISFNEAVKLADERLYNAKTQGRNQIVAED